MQTKTCSKCNECKPATDEFFNKSGATQSGITQPCLACRRLGAVNRNKVNYEKDKSNQLRHSYLSWDRSHGFPNTKLDRAAFASLLSKPCFYCDEVGFDIGGDRIDNALGHTLENMVPCCGVCNVVRNDIFTVEEMRQLGATIKSIRLARLETGNLLVRKRK